MKPVHLTFLTGIVLQAIEDGHNYGFDIMEFSGLPGGTVYPALRRLEAGGYLSSRWEDEASAKALKKPPRRFYELTPRGVELLESARIRFRQLSRMSDLTGSLPDPELA